MSVFEEATRQKLRFKSSQGLLSVEQVWDLPMTSKRPGAASIDNLGRDIKRELKALDDESFVTPSSTPQKAELQLQLAVLERIRDVGQATVAAAKAAADRAAQRQQILEALGNKEKEAINSLSLDELRARLAELNGEKAETATTS